LCFLQRFQVNWTAHLAKLPDKHHAQLCVNAAVCKTALDTIRKEIVKRVVRGSDRRTLKSMSTGKLKSAVHTQPFTIPSLVRVSLNCFYFLLNLVRDQFSGLSVFHLITRPNDASNHP
jgi:hypothetical protein